MTEVFATTTTPAHSERELVIDITESTGGGSPPSPNPEKVSPQGDPRPSRTAPGPLEGRLAVVTGGTGRVGRAVTEQLVLAGARVCIIGRDLPRLRRTASETGPADSVLFLQCDLGSAAEIDGISDFIDRFDRPIDVLVHTAGVDVTASVATGSIDDLDEQYLVNLRGPYLLTQKLLGQLTSARGHVVFVNSDAGLVARGGDAQRAITRFGLRGLADALRQEVRDLGIRVTSVYPPSVEDGTERLGASDIAASVVHAISLPHSVEITDVCLGSPSS